MRRISWNCHWHSTPNWPSIGLCNFGCLWGSFEVEELQCVALKSLQVHWTQRSNVFLPPPLAKNINRFFLYQLTGLKMHCATLWLLCFISLVSWIEVIYQIYLKVVKLWKNWAELRVSWSASREVEEQRVCHVRAVLARRAGSLFSRKAKFHVILNPLFQLATF